MLPFFFLNTGLYLQHGEVFQHYELGSHSWDYESAGRIISELFPLRLSKEVSGNLHQVFELHMTPDDAASHLFSNLYTYSMSGTGVF